jgi:hypothetical protein
MQTERVTYLTSAEHKAALEAFAKSRGESVGNVVREATARYISGPGDGEEERELAALVGMVNAAIPEMRKSLERSAARLDATHRKVDALLREAGIRK